MLTLSSLHPFRPNTTRFFLFSFNQTPNPDLLDESPLVWTQLHWLSNSLNMVSCVRFQVVCRLSVYLCTVCMFVCRSGGRWVGAKPQDDRFIGLSALYISLLLRHPHLFSSCLLHLFSIFIPLLLPYSSLFSVILIPCPTSVTSSSPFTVSYFSLFHLPTFCFSLFALVISQHLRAPPVFAVLLCPLQFSVRSITLRFGL